MAKKTPFFLSRRRSESEDGRIHLGENPGHGAIATILYIITNHYIYFAMLFMQLWGNVYSLPYKHQLIQNIHSYIVPQAVGTNTVR